MSVTGVHKDVEALTMRVDAGFDAPVERVWRLWADPRQLERWWGPPTYPATFTEHSLDPGATVRYYMTGPEGDRHHGWWRITSVEPPRRLAFDDGFADAEGNELDTMPSMTVAVALDEAEGGGTTMSISSHFPSRQAMEQLLEMGMEEGLVAAVGQIDALLAEAT
jgi:uncharacterized protein YndB with AHSA1/START domain